MLAATRTADMTVLQTTIDDLEPSARARDGARTLALLHDAVPEFNQPTGFSQPTLDIPDAAR